MSTSPAGSKGEPLVMANTPPAADEGPAPSAQNDASAPSNDDQANSGAPSISPTLPIPADFSLGERLVEIGRHPVILFGTVASGKTTIIMSLLKTLMTNPSVTVRLGDPILPDNHPYAADAHGRARFVVERLAQDFMHERKVMKGTETLQPFFIPLDIRSSDGGEPIRLALLEGKGEWYLPEKDITKPIHQELRAEIADVLKYYGNGISIIYVAPVRTGAADGRQADSDIGLSGAIAAYQRHRALIDEDSQLFLLTKWDEFADPLHNDPRFAHVEPEDVIAVLRARYPDSWNMFHSSPKLPGPDRRFFMQYVAGHIRDEVNRQPPARHAESFERYPRTILNWLYGNATRADISVGGFRSREKLLFPDVVDGSRVQVRLVERVTNFIFSR